jgi:hypothetical protein
VSFSCAEFEDALRAEAPELGEAAVAHAHECPRCGEQLRAWREISEAASGLRRDWESPELWPRIERALAAETRSRPPRWRLPSWAQPAHLASAAALLVAVLGAWLFLRSSPPHGDPLAREQAARRLLTEDALADVEKAESEHLRALEELSRLAEPRVAAPHSALLLSYREKLALLDAAIAECRTQIERNRHNAYLRRELVEIYNEKRRTLQQILDEEKNAL